MIKQKYTTHIVGICCLALLGALAATNRAEGKGGLEMFDLEEGTAVRWQSQSGVGVRIGAPTLVFMDPETQEIIPIPLKQTSHSTEQSAVTLGYQTMIEKGGQTIGGTCQVSITSPPDPKSDLLLYEVRLDFEQAVELDVTAQCHFQVLDRPAASMVLPERDGHLRSYPLAPENHGAGRYELGARAASGLRCNQVGIPVVGLAFDKKGDDPKGMQLAVSIDPYCGGHIQAGPAGRDTSVTVSTTYIGGTVPLTSEERTVALEFHQKGADGMLRSFYHTIPEIEPGGAWVHGVHLVYYDYLSDGGEGWFKGLKHLADRIPQEHRGRVAVCLHGWYDYFQQYAYDHKTGKLLDKWVAFPGTRKIPMSLDEMHKRIKFSKDLGFRTLLYFADGTNSDSGAPAFRKDYVFRSKGGGTVKGWKGPDSLGQPLRMDPAVPGLRGWYKGYLDALLKEYGREIDGLVWDETFYIPELTVSYTQQTPAYSDRAMMSLTSELTQMVQQYRKQNPDLVFLASDLGKTSYALVAHGTYQDSAMSQAHWGPSMFANYRNCLWSCNWYPLEIQTHQLGPGRNHYAATVLGLPQGISNGYGHNKGPHEMPQETLDQVIQRFLKNAKDDRQRTKYLVPPGK